MNRNSKGQGPRIGKSRPSKVRQSSGNRFEGRVARDTRSRATSDRRSSEEPGGERKARPIRDVDRLKQKQSVASRVVKKKVTRPNNEKSQVPRGDGKIRLNRYLSNSGVCSRRDADNLISSGCVTVNGKIVSELGSKVSISDEVRFNGQVLNPENKVYLLLNKPRGYVTTTDDPQERKTVMDLVRDACTERIYPVGRLDRETSGVLLFSNDGDLVKKLTHPSFSKKKIYQVTLDKPLSKAHLLELSQGIELEDGHIAADSISYVDEDKRREIGIEIHSGRNRIVRRMFEHFGYNVEKLDRVLFAGLTKKDLPRGRWRFLTQSEINILKM